MRSLNGTEGFGLAERLAFEARRGLLLMVPEVKWNTLPAMPDEW